MQTEPSRRQGYGGQGKRICKYSCERGQKRGGKKKNEDWGELAIEQ